MIASAARTVLRQRSASPVSAILPAHCARSHLLSPLVAARCCAPVLRPAAAGFGTEAQEAHAARVAAARAKWPHIDSGWGPTVSTCGRAATGLLVFGGAGVAAFTLDRNKQKRDGSSEQPEVRILERVAPEVFAALVGWGIVGAGLVGVFLATKMARRAGQRLIDGPTLLHRYMSSLTDASGAPNQSGFGRTVLGVAGGLGAVSAAWFLDGRADDS